MLPQTGHFRSFLMSFILVDPNGGGASRSERSVDGQHEADGNCHEDPGKDRRDSGVQSREGQLTRSGRRVPVGAFGATNGNRDRRVAAGRRRSRRLRGRGDRGAAAFGRGRRRRARRGRRGHGDFDSSTECFDTASAGLAGGFRELHVEISVVRGRGSVAFGGAQRRVDDVRFF